MEDSDPVILKSLRRPDPKTPKDRVEDRTYTQYILICHCYYLLTLLNPINKNYIT